MLDQTLLLEFFGPSRITQLPDTLNWKPYWGRAEGLGARIVHFHGLKPGRWRERDKQGERASRVTFVLLTSPPSPISPPFFPSGGSDFETF